MKLPCISLWQPWCYWVMLGYKTVETRLHQRFTSLTQRRIGIHAAQKIDANWKIAAQDYLTPKIIEETEAILELGGCAGHIICTAFVIESFDCDEDDSQEAMIYCGDVKRFGLLLNHIEKLEPAIPIKGMQGIFYVDVPIATGDRARGKHDEAKLFDTAREPISCQSGFCE